MRMAEASLPSEAADAVRLARLGWDPAPLLTEQHRPPTARHGQAEEVKSASGCTEA